MTEETKAKIKAAHLKRVQDDPAVGARLKAIANDPAMKFARSTKMRALWANPAWRAEQLAKMAVRNEAITAEAPAPAKKKRIITEAQKLKDAATRKAKRAAAKI